MPPFFEPSPPQIRTTAGRKGGIGSGGHEPTSTSREAFDDLLFEYRFDGANPAFVRSPDTIGSHRSPQRNSIPGWRPTSVHETWSMGVPPTSDQNRSSFRLAPYANGSSWIRDRTSPRVGRPMWSRRRLSDRPRTTRSFHPPPVPGASSIWTVQEPGEPRACPGAWQVHSTVDLLYPVPRYVVATTEDASERGFRNVTWGERRRGDATWPPQNNRGTQPMPMGGVYGNYNRYVAESCLKRLPRSSRDILLRAKG